MVTQHYERSHQMRCGEVKLNLFRENFMVEVELGNRVSELK